MLTLHLNALKEINPRAIISSSKVVNGCPVFKEDTLPGTWYRVFPATGKDVFFLMSLEQHLDKFAPAQGGGVLVHPRVLTVNKF